MGGQSKLLTLILGGGLEAFAAQTLTLINAHQRQFQPYTRLDTDD